MPKIRYIKDKNGEIVLPVTHERAVIDSNGVTLETKLGNKQDVIDANHKLSYSLLSGIPTIPTVPTISTAISADASSDTKTASPKAVKTYVDGICGDIETLLAAL